MLAFCLSMDSKQPTRPHKRPRASDGDQDRVRDTAGTQNKRSRLSRDGGAVGDDPTMPSKTVSRAGIDPLDAVPVTQSPLPRAADLRGKWSLSDPVAGQYSDLDPVFTRDEE